MNLYEKVQEKANQIEDELKQLGRWMSTQLPEVRFENMGPFGSNTMSFEQWIQFVLLPNIKSIVDEKGDFPNESHLATYAIRNFDGDPQTDQLQGLLYELDQLINNKSEEKEDDFMNEAVFIGDTTIPTVLYTLASVLPQFQLHDLESQLQTFDSYLEFLSPSVRPRISMMLRSVAEQINNTECKNRILQAAVDVAEGKRAATPYNHDVAMKKYMEEHRKNFPGTQPDSK